ncbi:MULTISPECIES: anthranilate synthase component I family protein [Micromonospora]|uniref:Anthranilate synthase component 1 n=1 Tax=Micromonospora vinacea TaxID=709878 RepID=A0ABS0KCC7_9ACTN|nr:anthranilate synthase component I family protein [Micromonospora vinacea]MBG6106215.1 anthranilate synthase component 1 [Micromonospora vinacea]WSZ77567.1 anthranilate synthase component I family protein [Micromonospora sp. NBC_00860]
MPFSDPPDASRIDVRTRQTAVPCPNPLAAYLALRPIFGAAGVYLLESLSGPASDRRSATVGFQPLLEISVRRGAVEVTGVAAVRDKAVAAGIGTGTLVETSDGLRLPDDPALWGFVRAVQARFDTGGTPQPGLGFLTFLGYDAVRYLEKLPYVIEDPDGPPDVTFVLYQGQVHVDLRDNSARLLVHESPDWPGLDLTAVTAALTAAPEPDAGLPPVPRPRSISDSTTEDAYVADVARCLHHIGVGDIYQIQIGHELCIESDVDELTIYRRLRQRNPSPYMCLLPIAGRTLIGSSPELFVRVEGDAIAMRPIAGTTSRGADEVENERRVAALRADDKEIAEHVMLVDLCRNDLGRICRADTVEVDEMMVVEDFSHVFHLVSNVTGRLEPDTDAYDVITATFPAGTMTGAPKIRAMEIIEATESSRRGLYAGAFGHIDFSGEMVLALSIRAVVGDGTGYRTRASAGVVADSVPSREWRETLAKMSAAVWAVTGEELL